jgi:O-methyltransferase involved in polyketide biosynthesis
MEAIRATLATVAACAAGTRIALTYNLPRSALQGLGVTVNTAVAAIIAELDEPVVSLFTPAEVESVLREHGFADIAHIGPEEAARAYFPGRADVRFGGAQRLVVATVPGVAGPGA